MKRLPVLPRLARSSCFKARCLRWSRMTAPSSSDTRNPYSDRAVSDLETLPAAKQQRNCSLLRARRTLDRQGVQDVAGANRVWRQRLP